jgi:hypothetical protein
MQRAADLDGDHYEILTPAANALAGKHPLSATLVLRAMIDFSLTQSRLRPLSICRSPPYGMRQPRLIDRRLRDVRVARDLCSQAESGAWTKELFLELDFLTGFATGEGLE